MPSEFVKEVADVFAKDGPLSKVTANYTPRPSQIEFATSVAEALEPAPERRLLILFLRF